MTGKLDLTFPHRYEVEQLGELPSGAGERERRYFPGASEEGGRDGLLIRVKPDVGEPWIGIFAYGDGTPAATTGIYSCPDERSFCIISAGDGYIVRADDPLTWEEIQAYPVLDVRPVLARSLLVFVDFTSILAYGRTGVAWRTGQISSDGLEVKEITSRYIRGLAFDAVQQREVDFLVDLETGLECTQK
jgi:hypothetical protein